MCDWCVWSTRINPSVTRLFQMLLLCLQMILLFCRNFFDSETFNVMNCATLALMLINLCCWLVECVSKQRALHVSVVERIQGNSQLNLREAQNQRQRVSSHMTREPANRDDYVASLFCISAEKAATATPTRHLTHVSAYQFILCERRIFAKIVA